MPQNNSKTASAQDVHIDIDSDDSTYCDPHVSCKSSECDACACISVRLFCLLALVSTTIALAVAYSKTLNDSENDLIATNASQELLNSTFNLIEIMMNGTATGTATQTQTNTPTPTRTETPSATPTHTSTYTRVIKTCINRGTNCVTRVGSTTYKTYVDVEQEKQSSIGSPGLLLGAIAAGICILPILIWIASCNFKKPCTLRLFSHDDHQGRSRQVNANTLVPDKDKLDTHSAPRPGSTTTSD